MSYIRGMQVARLERTDRLPDHMLSKLHHRFQRRCEAQKPIDVEELDIFLCELMPVQGNRGGLALEAARFETMVVEECSPEVTGKVVSVTCSFEAILSLARRYRDAVELEAWKREELELEAWGLGEREVAWLREAFFASDKDEDGWLIGQEVQDALDFRGEVPEVSTAKSQPKSWSGPSKTASSSHEGYSRVDLLGLLALAQELEMRRARQLEHCDCPVLVGSGCKTTPAS
mmetsp:Transcript_23024/g.64758  ORF Transcript_23024/g.64758 Transcript_23024/m.64758 type:complete len:231 (-) Transcript_23024:28-720(-)